MGCCSAPWYQAGTWLNGPLDMIAMLLLTCRAAEQGLPSMKELLASLKAFVLPHMAAQVLDGLIATGRACPDARSA